MDNLPNIYCLLIYHKASKAKNELIKIKKLINQRTFQN